MGVSHRPAGSSPLRRLVLGFALIMVLSLAVAASTGGDLRVRTQPAERVQARDHAPTVDHEAQLARAQAAVQYGQIIEVGGYVVARARADLVAYLASIPPPVAVESTMEPAHPVAAPATGAVGACGGATNGADQFIMRESGGDPNALNPSGAWGCYQIMPGTWAGAGCDDLGPYGSASPAAQAQCASRLPDSAWAL